MDRARTFRGRAYRTQFVRLARRSRGRRQRAGADAQPRAGRRLDRRQPQMAGRSVGSRADRPAHRGLAVARALPVARRRRPARALAARLRQPAGTPSGAQLGERAAGRAAARGPEGASLCACLRPAAGIEAGGRGAYARCRSAGPASRRRVPCRAWRQRAVFGAGRSCRRAPGARVRAGSRSRNAASRDRASGAGLAFLPPRRRRAGAFREFQYRGRARDRRSPGARAMPHASTRARDQGRIRARRRRPHAAAARCGRSASARLRRERACRHAVDRGLVRARTHHRQLRCRPRRRFRMVAGAARDGRALDADARRHELVRARSGQADAPAPQREDRARRSRRQRLARGEPRRLRAAVRIPACAPPVRRR